MTDDLAEFLLARIAKDEDNIRSAVEMHEAWPYGSSVRFLAECAAKLRIVERARRWHDEFVRPGTEYVPEINDVDVTYDEVLRLLALPYADHPDYREEWKP